MAAEYTETFARFILECADAYRDLCERIEAGEVPAARSATLTIEIPREVVDGIRAERLLAMAQENGDG